MAIRIKTATATVEVDTLSEFSLVWKELQNMNGQKPSEYPESRVKHKQGRKARLQQRNHASLYKFLGDSRQAQLLKILREKPDGTTDDELRSRLALKSNNQLAGIMAGLSKNVKKFSFAFEEIIRKEPRVTESGKRGYQYQLTNEMLEVVPGVLV